MNTLKETWLITNYSCNNRCKWCYTTDKGFVNYDMPLKFAKDTLLELSKNGVKKCTLIGGEPTLYPYLKELISYGSQLGLFMKIVTNGVKLSDEKYLEELKKAGLSLTAISIHGYTPEGYRQNTQTDNLHNVEKAILNCKQKNIPFVTLTTLNRLNCNDVLDIVKYLTKLEVDNIIFNIAVPYTTKGSVDQNVLTPQEIADIITKYYFSSDRKKYNYGFYASIPLCLFDKSILKDMIDDNFLIPLSEGGCNIFEGTGFAVEPNGNIIPCCKKNTEVITNICRNGEFLYKNSFDSFWDIVSKNLGHEAMPYPDKKCYDCSIRTQCIGGCPMFWSYYDKTLYIKGE